jgi:hypothetical protein
VTGGAGSSALLKATSSRLSSTSRTYQGLFRPASANWRTLRNSTFSPTCFRDLARPLPSPVFSPVSALGPPPLPLSRHRLSRVSALRLRGQSGGHLDILFLFLRQHAHSSSTSPVFHESKVRHGGSRAHTMHLHPNPTISSPTLNPEPETAAPYQRRLAISQSLRTSAWETTSSRARCPRNSGTSATCAISTSSPRRSETLNPKP